MKMKKYILLLLLTLSFVKTYSQEIEMADTMRANGKIYVVVAVVTVVLIGIFLYLIKMDKKISSIEKELNKK